ncbi:MAG: imidazole glycerol phosphate synthase subunit HisH [Bacteroidetes bacterium]|nr:imidazole glycerol phosphate synthase subunit HisH [Bacteroidota bacterium]
MKVAIIKYNAGNIQSVTFALERIGVNPIITDNADEILSADKIIFPGVGEASSAMTYLRNNNLDKLIVSLKQPTLGICLGMQLMCNHSEEGDTNCLGIFDSSVKKFDYEKQQENTLKVPQIGWNTIYNLNSKLFNKIKENEYMYFVHSYYVEKSNDMIATTNYGIEYSSALQKNNFYAVQFHPEKSSDAGQQIMQNFIAL